MAAPDKSLYKRQLPSDLVPFSSPHGKSLFKSALLQGNMEGYFPLAEQFLTQNRPDHCAKSTLVMALNTLQIDPKRVWIKPWRWFTEELLACLSEKSGLSIHEFAMVGLCNGVWQQAFHPVAQRGRDGVTVLPKCCDSVACGGCGSVGEEHASSCSGCQFTPLDDCCNPNSSQLRLKYASLSTFRAAIKASLRREGFLLLLNHSRKALNQTGDGHYSPVAGFDEESDMALVLDVARFKYPAFWVPVERLYQSLEYLDKESGKMRGFLLVGRPKNGNFAEEMEVDQLSVARVKGRLNPQQLLLDPPCDLYPVLLYHFTTLSEALIPDDIYAKFQQEAESSPLFPSTPIDMSAEMSAFLDEVTEGLKPHYLAVIRTAVEGEAGEETPLFRLFVSTLRVQLGIDTHPAA